MQSACARSFILGFAWLLLASECWTVQPEKAVHDFLSDLKDQERVLRHSYNTSDTVYLRVGGTVVHVIRKGDALFPTIVDEPVKIVDASVFYGGVRLRIESAGLGKARLEIRTVDDVPLTIEMLDAVIQRMFISPNDSFPAVLIDPESNWAHLNGCNHLYIQDVTQTFFSLDEAEAAGHPKCPLCFQAIRRFSIGTIERELGYQMAAWIRAQYASSRNRAEQQRLWRVGQSVVESWPWPIPSEFRIHFTLLESGVRNAFAAAHGEIFVTSSMLRMTENDAELEVIIAHEIAHVLRHHSYLILQRMRQTRAIAGAASTAIAFGTGLNLRNDKTTMRLFDLAPVLAQEVIATGYGQLAEEEADAITEIYMHTRKIPRKTIEDLFKKLQYVNDIYSRDSGFLFLPEHPDLDTRLEMLERSQIRKLDPPLIYAGYNREGECVATVHLDLERIVEPRRVPLSPLDKKRQTVRSHKTDEKLEDSRHELIGFIETTSLLGGTEKLGAVTLQSSNRGRQRYANRNVAEVLPNALSGLFLRCMAEEHPAFIGEVEEFEMDVPNVVRWERIIETEPETGL